MRAAIVVAVLMAAGCAAPYAVEEHTDKFSDPGRPQTFVMYRNAIDFRDPMGAVLTDELNGYVDRDRKTGAVVEAGFVLFRNVNSRQIAVSGGPKWLSIRPGDELVFIADGERIALPAVAAKTDHKTSYNTISGVDTDYIDHATYKTTPDVFRKIAYAKSLEFQAIGSEGRESFPGINRSLLKSFQMNLQKFYTENMAR